MSEAAAGRPERLRGEIAKTYRLLGGRWPARISIGFYPYSTLRHSIRRRGQGLELRISDILEDAPDRVVEAISTLLLYKLFGRRPPPSCRSLYRQYIARDEVVARVRQVRRGRSRKTFPGPVGKHFDLQPLFDRLNESFFNNELEMDRVSWSPGKSRRTLGYFDPAFKAIVISRALDRRDVPESVVAFVVYHEMLHAFLGEQVRNGRRLKHHARFKAAERDFPAYEEAMRFISEKL